ncbi:MAG: hypothetical protein QOH47_2370 [Sphingomonadales bacterium]|jgi:hypothetical protein|nr:hypothetical protein [Sphingomonadales bacterium]
MTDLLALAETIEAATGPDRRLDTLVEIARNPDKPWVIGEKPGRWPREAIFGTLADMLDWAMDETKVPPEIGAPAYTSSLDAAMTLVPDGYRVSQLNEETDSPDRPWVVSLSVRIGAPGRMLVYASAATPALALTAASLRARHAMEKGSG